SKISHREQRIMLRVTILSLTLLLGHFAPAAAQAIAFEAARIIPGDGSPALEDAGMLVEAGVITRIGRRSDIAIPATARRIDLGGKTLMPALISTHVHPGFQKMLTYSAENFTRETIIDDLER